jgi:hypothetical protein
MPGNLTCRFCRNTVAARDELGMGRQFTMCSRHLKLALRGGLGVTLAGVLISHVWKYRHPFSGPLAVEQAERIRLFVEELMRMGLNEDRRALQERVPAMAVPEWTFFYGLLQALAQSHPRAKQLLAYAESLRADKPPQAWLN